MCSNQNTVRRANKLASPRRIQQQKLDPKILEQDQDFDATPVSPSRSKNIKITASKSPVAPTLQKINSTSNLKHCRKMSNVSSQKKFEFVKPDLKAKKIVICPDPIGSSLNIRLQKGSISAVLLDTQRSAPIKKEILFSLKQVGNVPEFADRKECNGAHGH